MATMITGKQIVLVDSEKSEGIYLDGQLCAFTHDGHLPVSRVLRLLGVPFTTKWAELKKGELLPDSLAEIKSE